MSTAQLILGNDPAFQLASALEAIRKAEQDFAGMKADHKARMEALYAEVDKLRTSILTGQKQLPLEPIAEPKDVTQAIAEAFVERVNSTGELNLGGLTVTPR
jgi:hypothetical protein